MAVVMLAIAFILTDTFDGAESFLVRRRRAVMDRAEKEGDGQSKGISNKGDEEAVCNDRNNFDRLLSNLSAIRLTQEGSELVSADKTRPLSVKLLVGPDGAGSAAGDQGNTPRQVFG
jgi:hypothetical protein